MTTQPDARGLRPNAAKPPTHARDEKVARAGSTIPSAT
jgi:hypothetical protein